MIQRASERALKHGFGLEEIFAATAKSAPRLKLRLSFSATSIHCCNTVLANLRALLVTQVSMASW